MLQATEWQHLPSPGGLLDQDEALMEDLTVIAWQSGIVSAILKEQESGAAF